MQPAGLLDPDHLKTNTQGVGRKCKLFGTLGVSPREMRLHFLHAQQLAVQPSHNQLAEERLMSE